MSEKKQASKKNAPAHVVRVGEVTAIVMLHKSHTGYPFYDFAISRSWQSMVSGRESTSNSLFADHEEDAVTAVRQAAAWIRAKANRGPVENQSDQ